MYTTRIAVHDVRPGMQVRNAGVWWQVIQYLVHCRTPQSQAVMAKRVRSSGFVTHAGAGLLWLPRTAAGIEVRPGTPNETTVLGAKAKTIRVRLVPRSARDPQPYVDSNGNRWAVEDTAGARRVAGLAEAFGRGLTA